VTDAITIQNPRNRGGSTGHVLAKRSVTFTEIRMGGHHILYAPPFLALSKCVGYCAASNTAALYKLRRLNGLTRRLLAPISLGVDQYLEGLA